VTSDPELTEVNGNFSSQQSNLYQLSWALVGAEFNLVTFNSTFNWPLITLFFLPYMVTAFLIGY